MEKAEGNNGRMPFEVLDGDEVDDVVALNRLVAEMGESESEDGFVTVYRIEKTGRGKGVYLKRYDVAELESGSLLEVVREQFGAGVYQFSVYHSTGGLKARKVIQLAELPGMKRVESPGESSKELVQVMLAGFQELGKMIAATKQPAPDEMQMLERMKLYKELFGGSRQQVQATGTQDAQALLSAMMSGIKLAKGLGSEAAVTEENNADWLERMAEKFAEPIIGALMTPGKRETAKVVEGGAAVVKPAQNKQEGGDDMNVMVKFYVNKLVSAAAQKDDAMEHAEKLYLMLDGDISMLNAPDWWPQLCKINPAAAAHKEWFDDLHAKLIGIDQQQEQEQ